MTNEEKRIKIAEACGWHGNLAIRDGVPMGRPPGTTDRFEEVPDYLNDLNAMHEAEKVLSKEQRIQYMNTLQRMFVDLDGYWNWFTVANADAAQRAEAFGKTLNLW